jgi:hypothetical protein
MSLFIIDYLVQPALVGVFVLAKDVLYDEYLPDNPHVLIDIATNMFAKLVSRFVTIEFVVPALDTSAADWIEPLFHGLINGGIKSRFVNTDNFNAISMMRSTFTQPSRGNPRRLLPPISHYTMQNGFIEGASYNLAAKVVTFPLEIKYSLKALVAK